MMRSAIVIALIVTGFAPALADWAPNAKGPVDPGIPAAIQIETERVLTLDDDGEKYDREAIAEFYAARAFAPLWVNSDGVTDKGRNLVAVLRNAAAYGLDPKEFPVPDLSSLKTPDALGAADHRLTLSTLTYVRQARGGRISFPRKMLNSHLDRKPQYHTPADVLDEVAAAYAGNIRATMTAFHPVHPQFEKLRRAFVKLTRDGKGGGPLNAKAQKLRANMEFWRWMWDDLGDLYVFNNLPEFMQYVVKDGKVIRKARIVVGELDKQSSVFSRPLRSVDLRPKWRVPTSIMVKEIWPSLLRGGGYMRQYGLEITTKSGEPVDWRRVDWRKNDIRNYHVWQPPGRRSVLGFVKFSFPSQHTIYMHDTPDKWMFRRSQRTLSHGCLRVQNPMELTEIILEHDRGWDRAKIRKEIKSGPQNNVLRMKKHIPIHLVYFTAWADDDGQVRYFPDIYGHEKRVRLALEGKWDQINKGRDHLAPVQVGFDPNKVARSSGRRTKQSKDVGSMISNALSLDF